MQAGPLPAQPRRAGRKLAAFERFVDALAALAAKMGEAPAGRAVGTTTKAVA